MKTFKILIILTLVFGSLTIAFGQTAAARFTEAKEAYNNSQFEKTLTLLDAMEK